jgi:tryptophan-rich sensory protein
MGVWLMNALLFALLGVIYLGISNGMRASTTATILLLLCVQQVFILFRTAQRIAGWGSALEIYVALWLPIHSPFEPELVPSLAGGDLPELSTGAEATPEPEQPDDYGV